MSPRVEGGRKSTFLCSSSLYLFPDFVVLPRFGDFDDFLDELKAPLDRDGCDWLCFIVNDFFLDVCASNFGHLNGWVELEFFYNRNLNTFEIDTHRY